MKGAWDMNKEPKPDEEPKLPFDTCMSCEQEYTLSKENTYVFRYEDMPGAEHLSSICPHCQQLNIAFLGTEDNKEHFAQFGYGIANQTVPGVGVMEAYLNLYEIPLVQEQELTPRQEAHVKYLGHLLTSDYLTPEDFEGDGNSELFV